MYLQLVDFASRFMSSYSNNLHFPACFAAPISDLFNSALIQSVAYESFSILQMSVVDFYFVWNLKMKLVP